MQLPLFKVLDVQLTLWQTRWKSLLDPVIASLLVQGQLIESISITPGVTMIPHKLGRLQRGWFPVYNSAVLNNMVVSQPFNTTTLYLQGSNTATISLWVF